jgi:hypothetical protein
MRARALGFCGPALLPDLVQRLAAKVARPQRPRDRTRIWLRGVCREVTALSGNYVAYPGHVTASERDHG